VQYPVKNRHMSDSGSSSGLAQSRLPLGLLAAAGFLSALGARIIDPLLAVLAHDFQTTVAATSVLVAAFTFPYGINQLLVGPLGDRYGKLRVLLLALTGYTIFMTACAFATGLPSLILLRACAGACSGGLIPTCLAYIGDAVPYQNRQVALSRFLTGVVLAQAISGPLGGLFGEFLGWPGVFLLLGGIGFLTAILLATQLRGLPDIRHQRSVFNRQNYLTLLRHPPARLLLLMTLVEGAWLPGAFPFIAPYLVERFDLSYVAVGLILSAFGLGALFYTRYASTLVRVLGEPGLVLAGGFLVAGSLMVAFQLDSWPLFILVQMSLGLGYFMLHGVMQARATELLPEARATAVSSFVFMLFLGQALGALSMGAHIGNWGYRTAFHIDIAGVTVLTLCLFVYMRRAHLSDVPG
jgi:predicted MFS family arabinose efflux permease